MQYSEDDLLPISALQHYQFCKRQCALIHVEGQWSENILTMQGNILHEKVHGVEDESRGDMKISRGLHIRSLELGIVGKADVVEFHSAKDGTQTPYPVEFKRGKPKIDNCDRVQLCAQALCLEEMLETHVPEGAIYYGTPHRRETIACNEPLRAETMQIIADLRVLLVSGTMPGAIYTKKCQSCSLIDVCMPRSAGVRKSAVRYLERELR